MAFSFTGIFTQLKLIFKGISTGKLIAMMIIVGGAAAGLAFLVIWSGKAEYSTLYSNLAPEDAAEIVSTLKGNKIPYQLSIDGKTVRVPFDSIHEIRLDLASKGLPKGGSIGFEVFDDTKLGMTEFVQNVNYQRALQGELTRTINGLHEVESSRVHIVMSSRSLFIEEEEPATASVILKLRAGRWLSKDQIQGIVHLVSSSVSGLEPDNVTILDSSGKMLAGFKDGNEISRVTSDQLAFQEKKERTLENRIKTMLESVLGRDKAIVRVSCLLDFVQQEKTEELYLPNNRVIRSEQSLNELSSEPSTASGGVPGLKSNVTGNQTKSARQAGNKQFQKKDKTTNYEIGKTTSRKILPVGSIKRLSVAVVVDGTYTKAEEAEAGEAQLQYVARTAEEMTKIENIVKSAVDFDKKRGDNIEVVNIPFATDTEASMTDQAPKNQWLDMLKEYQMFIKYGIAGLFILLTFMTILRPLARWLTSTPLEEIEMFQNLPQAIKELENQYSQERGSLDYTKRAAQMLANNTDDSRQLAKQWVKES